MTRGRVSDQLRSTIDAAAAPYGYTLTTFATGSLAIRSRPASPLAVGMLYVVGAITGFVLLAWLAAGRTSRVSVPERPESAQTHVLGYAHLVACGIAIAFGVASLRLVPGDLAPAACGLAATFAYVLLVAVQFSLSRPPAAAPRQREP